MVTFTINIPPRLVYIPYMVLYIYINQTRNYMYNY